MKTNNETLENYEPLLQDFAEYVISTLGRSTGTGIIYKSSARRYITFFYTKNKSETSLTINQAYLEGFITWLRNENCMDGTVEARVYAIRRFWRFLYKKEMAPPPVSLDILEIRFKKEFKRTIPVAEQDYFKMLRNINADLRIIK
jgi:site-specific recombinase XerD